MYFLLFLSWTRKRIGNKTCFFKNYICHSIITIHNCFSFFLWHLNNTFETTLSCALVITWNIIFCDFTSSYYGDYQTTQTGSRTTAISKMELYVTIFDSFHSLTIVINTPHLRFYRRPRSDYHYKYFCFAGRDLDQFKANFFFI